MDLPERLLTNKEASRLGMNRVTFEPYTHEQLKIIVTSRLENLVVFKPEAIELCARKIAATSGDARRCLDICRAATEMAQERAEGELKKVGIPEIDAVIKRMHKNTTVVSVRNSSWQQQLFLVSLLQVLKRSGMEEARLHQIIGQFLKICKSHSFNSPSESQISGIARVLSAMRVIHSEPCVTDFHRRIRLNTDATAVDMALRQDKTLKKILSGSVV
ncbi:hypothetical protein SARC_00493 [Sphaeroforma arctica JP610]|uniref:Origin recognition complex subunit 1 n=1 Tax=Sphaeroforma arctica JP610 TaxID=667725 RepID=A0A0L0GEE9_9EUKA|nr:hypothetical protein SARC_00493 [Sphaeroforma arctica JP610]KNC87402.1 hypothetical protein SARC_00493 [Sphaeroforma arctica JP610]|eukprot:XP_014161304.1 hypothetical protein SARC_00493 [Sphaeroforma arctica JP610]